MVRPIPIKWKLQAHLESFARNGWLYIKIIAFVFIIYFLFINQSTRSISLVLRARLLPLKLNFEMLLVIAYKNNKMEPATLLSEISSNETPVVDPNVHTISEPILSEKAAQNDAKDALNPENLPDPSSTYSKRQLKRLKKFEDRLKKRDEWK